MCPINLHIFIQFSKIWKDSIKMSADWTKHKKGTCQILKGLVKSNVDVLKLEKMEWLILKVIATLDKTTKFLNWK